MGAIQNYLRDERGITTIEWVAITAVAMLAAFGISNMVLGGANDLGGSVADRMSAAADDASDDGNRGGRGGDRGRGRGR